MNSTAKSYTGADRRKPVELKQPVDYGWTLFLIIVTLAMVAGFFVANDRLYRSGDRFGYDIGLIGGLMMATLLLYPLRKRVKFMKNWIILPKWFKWHMVFGIVGPALIMFHATFTIKSINAGVALVCMMLVSGSGIFGRFFYTKIHAGLYGRQVSLSQLQSSVGGGKDVDSIFSFVPNIQNTLAKFRTDALKSVDAGKLPKPWEFLKVGVQVPYLKMTLLRELEDAMYADAGEKNWTDMQMRRLDELFAQNKEFIEEYLETIKSIAQFGTYERLFSLWHIFHVPLVFMLVFSAIWHVIAVHMY